MPDYYSKEINGKKCLFIGGAISIDRIFRVEGKTYWKDEALVPSRFPISEHDYVFSHTAPSYFDLEDSLKGDMLNAFAKDDVNLLDDCRKEREIMNHNFDQTQPSKWYFGHFHVHAIGQYKNCHWKCVDVDESVEVS